MVDLDWRGLRGQGRVRLEPGAKGDAVALGTTNPATRILGRNPARVAWLVVNKGTGRAYVGFSQGVTTTGAGIPMSADNGGVRFDREQDGDAVASEVFGIADAAGNVAVYAWEVY